MKIYATDGSLVLNFPSSCGPVLPIRSSEYVGKHGLQHGPPENLPLHFRWVLGPPGNLRYIVAPTYTAVGYIFIQYPTCSAVDRLMSDSRGNGAAIFLV